MSPRKMQDRRALQAFRDPAQKAVIVDLDRRLGALEQPDYALLAPTFTVGTENNNQIPIGVQLREVDGSIPVGQRVVEVWLSGDQLDAALAIDDALAVDTGATQLRVVTALAWLVVLTDDTGYFRLLATHTAATTRYLNVWWQGRLFASEAVTWA